MAHLKKPEISDYYCYRSFLNDFFEFKKQNNPNYSYRLFTNKAGLKSSGHLKMVIERQRNLGNKTLPMYLNALDFTSKKEATLFELLVKYDQSKLIDEKTILFEKILAEKKKHTSSILASNQYMLLSQWYVVATYVLIGIENFTANKESIFKAFQGRLTKFKISQALELLMETGLIKKDGSGYKQVSGSISTPDKIKSMAVNKYHQSMIELSLKSVKEDPVEERNFNGVTIAIGPKNFEMLTKKLNELRKEINEMISNDEEATRVYQVCINLFPLTGEVK
ncbi:MAG: TIGR02147 family protein [Bdellovibrionales bacterium]|nr:TIGR02147 family protein [Bdellovibrionales bacterium]